MALTSTSAVSTRTAAATITIASSTCNFSAGFPADRVLELDLQLDPAVLAWGPVSGQRLQSLTGKASSLLRSLRRSAADTLAVIIQDNT